MKLKYKRLNTLIIFMMAIASTIFFVLKALEEKIVFFYSPTEILNKDIRFNDMIRVGGLVVDNSIVYDSDGLEVFFTITDKKNSLNVSYKGMLPDLFREGQGVVAEGKLNVQKIFIASKIFAKHDENYLPPEIADAIKKEGQWKGD